MRNEVLATSQQLSGRELRNYGQFVKKQRLEEKNSVSKQDGCCCANLSVTRVGTSQPLVSGKIFHSQL